MASICLCMIAKNEEKNIERCIQSVEGLVDEIVVADTGSTDNTVKFAERLGAKVYNYPWDDNFANARNFAISKVKSEWMLLLDADEALDKAGAERILEFIDTTDLDGAHFRIRNYTGRYSPENYSLHSGLRLLRKSDRYHFHGEIHEQVTAKNGENLSNRFTTLDVIVHHYGYLDEVVREKQKRRRNIPILEKQLKQAPNEPFTLFNMGNEYLSMQNYKTALEYYGKALENLKKRNIAFVPHLFFRVINCHDSLKEYEKALQAVQSALNEFPSCTDYEFLRGNILHKLGRYTLAVESFETCLKMGPPPPSLEFLPGCGTYKTACQLGELYRELEDYKRAVKYYDLALSQKADLYSVLYRVGNVFNKMFSDNDQAAQKLFSYFANPKYAPNALLGADILVEEALYSQALNALEDLTDFEGHEMESAYVKARALFYQQKFDEVFPLLNQVCETPEPEKRVLRGIRPVSAIILFSAGLMKGDESQLLKAIEHVRCLCSEHEYNAVVLMYDIFLKKPVEAPYYEEEGKSELETMIRVLDMLLKCRHFDLFEQMLHALNYVDSKDILLRIARLYDENGLLPMASDHVLRSIKELNTLDLIGAKILLRRHLYE